MKTFYLAVTFVAVGASEVVPKEYSVTATTVGQIILFLTTLLGIGVTIYRENRSRQWAKEDAAELAKEVERKAAILATAVEAKADSLAETVVTTAEGVKEDTERIVRHVGANVENVVTLRANEAHDEREEVKSELKRVADEGVRVQKVEVVNDPAHSVPVQEQPKPNP